MTRRAAPASAREATKEDEVLQWRSLRHSDAASGWQGIPAGPHSLAHADFDGAGTVSGRQCQPQTPRPEASIRRPALGGRRPRRAALASAHDHAPLTCILSALLLAAGKCFRAPGITVGLCMCKQQLLRGERQQARRKHCGPLTSEFGMQDTCRQPEHREKSCTILPTPVVDTDLEGTCSLLSALGLTHSAAITAANLLVAHRRCSRRLLHRMCSAFVQRESLKDFFSCLIQGWAAVSDSFPSPRQVICVDSGVQSPAVDV